MYNYERKRNGMRLRHTPSLEMPHSSGYEVGVCDVRDRGKNNSYQHYTRESPSPSALARGHGRRGYSLGQHRVVAVMGPCECPEICVVETLVNPRVPQLTLFLMVC